ncbi:delta-aminolevulinic acid dehydratase [Photobacterium leiognathi]|uniref:delta-aminolevulinic acid dehydratase n=1 Tax=Photobacterium leiognathi TaxID=553611 RepID=UPI001EDEE81B|nr:delta-aminolevulinic acid dehydratase [Photobacterium leiognathi]MCG3886225.1 delta-aminolevulinic acid dehydratase [Photobacterium leiognathi]
MNKTTQVRLIFILLSIAICFAGGFFAGKHYRQQESLTLEKAKQEAVQQAKRERWLDVE